MKSSAGMSGDLDSGIRGARRKAKVSRRTEKLRHRKARQSHESGDPVVGSVLNRRSVAESRGSRKRGPWRRYQSR